MHLVSLAELAGGWHLQANTLLGPYQWCNYAVNPKSTQCDAFPGDLIFDDVGRQMYFVESYGSVYRGTSNEGPLEFKSFPKQKLLGKGRQVHMTT